MKEFTYTIHDEYGIHARPAGMLVKSAKGFDSCITLKRGDDECNLKSLLPLMAMGVKKDQTVTVQVEGTDEEACVQALSDFMASNL